MRRRRSARLFVYVAYRSLCRGERRIAVLGKDVLQAVPVLDEVVQTHGEQPGTEGLGNVRVGSALITLDFLLVHGIGGEHHHGDVRGLQLRLQPAATLQPIHHGHHHVADDGVGHVLHGQAYALLAVGRLDNLILVLQYGPHIVAYVLIVVDNEHTRFVVGRRLARLGLQRLLVGSQYGPLFQVGKHGTAGSVGVESSRLPGRHLYGEAGTLPLGRLHAYGAVVHFDKGLDQSQPDTRAGMVDVYLVEAVEDVLHMLGRHAHAGIGDLQPQVGARPRGRIGRG